KRCTIPNAVAFSQQPSGISAGGVLPAVSVQVKDAYGNVLTTDTSSVTLAIGTSPSGSTLRGTKTVAAVAGLATFSDLTLDKAGTGYTLAASDASLTSATSNSFNVTPGAAAKLVFGQQPSNTAAGSAITPAVTVQVQDASGNVVTS